MSWSLFLSILMAFVVGFVLGVLVAGFLFEGSEPCAACDSRTVRASSDDWVRGG